MKKTVLLLAVMTAFLSLTSRAQNRETRNVGTFTKISFRVPGKLYLRQGNTQKVELEGSKDALSRIETDVEGSRLVIAVPGRWTPWKDDDEVNIYITVKDVEAISVGGSGDLIGETVIRSGDLDLGVSGSGSMKIEIQASGSVSADVSGSGVLNVRGSGRELDSDVSGSGRVTASLQITGAAELGISGSGKIEIDGRAESVRTSISGSGRVLGENFEVKRCIVRISGSGDVEMTVREELDASISGSGSVRYKGNPNKVHSNASGSGKVSKIG